MALLFDRVLCKISMSSEESPHLLSIRERDENHVKAGSSSSWRHTRVLCQRPFVLE